MKTTISRVERLFIYTGLACAIGLGLGWRPTDTAAYAQSAGSAATMKVATVDILGVTERLVSTDRYRSARDTNTSAQNSVLQGLVNQLEEIQKRGLALSPESPDREKIAQEFSTKDAELRRAQSQAAAQVEKFNTLQVAEAYKAVMDAANRLGTSLGYTHIFATRSGDAVIRSDNVPGAVQEMLARPIVKGEPLDDLTEKLVKELNIPDNTVPVATPVPATDGAAPR